jgi:hypothetical protein
MMISKDTVWKDSEKFGEKNDCSVKAVALATGIKYAKVHYAFRKQGRKEGRGTHFYQQFAVLRELGFELKLVHVGHYNDPKVKNKFKAKTVFGLHSRSHALCSRRKDTRLDTRSSSSASRHLPRREDQIRREA